MIRRAMIKVAAALSRAEVAAALIIVTFALEVACIIWPEIQQAVTTHLSFAAIFLAFILLVAGGKDTEAIQAKLDEGIRANPRADNRLIGVEKQD